MGSALSRYRNPSKRIKQTDEYNKKNYTRVQLTFSKKRDAKLLADLQECKSKTEEVRKWYRQYKKED